VRVEAGRDEAPDLKQEEGHGKRHGRVERHLEVERERLHRGRHDQLVLDAGQRVGDGLEVEGQAHAARDDGGPGDDGLVREDAELFRAVARHPDLHGRAGRDDARAQLDGLAEHVAARVALPDGTQGEDGLLARQPLERHGAPLRLGQSLADGDGEEVVDVVGEVPAEAEGDGDEEDGADEATAQLVEVFEKRHLPAEPLLGLVALVVALALK
jgi:hypothetical protein